MYQKTKSLGGQMLSKRLFAVLLMCAMVISLVGMIAPAKEVYAAGAYSAYLVNSDDTEESLAGKKVIFNGYEWYIIEDNSTSATEGSVTLFAVNPIGAASQFHGSSNKYSSSTVKGYLDGLTAEGGSFADVADAIVSCDLTTKGYNSSETYDSVTGAKLYLLSKEEAQSLPAEVRKCNAAESADLSQYALWWLRSPGSIDVHFAARVYGADGHVGDGGGDVKLKFGVRPALQLNLSAVEFLSEDKTFKHKHNFAYSLSEDKSTIKATCNGKGKCDITTGLSMTISAPDDLIYNGQPKEATLNSDYNKTAFPGNYTIIYSKQGSSLSEAPVDAGTYTASVTFGKGRTAKKISVGYTINPKSITGATITIDKTETTYNGSEQSVNVSEVKLDGITLAETDFDISGNKGTDADDYTVTVTGKGNFKDTATANWKINKAESSIKTAPVSKSLKYNGQSQELVTAGEAKNGTVYYALGKDSINAPAESAYSASIPTSKEAGTYYVWYKAVGNDNYNDSEAKCVTSHIIGEISHKVTFKVVNGSWNDGTKEDKTVMLSGHEGDTLKLSADQIPVAGTKPSDKYKEGSWDIIPSSATEITKDITYTYTYEKQDITIVPEPVQKDIIVNLKSVKQKSNKVQVSWSRVKEADGYDVYVHYCKSKAKKPAKTIKKNSVTTISVNKIDGKKINLKEDFHVYVVAYKMVDGKKVTLAKTVTAHFAGTKSADYTNPKALKLTKSAFSIKAGKTANIKAKVTLADKNKKHLPAWHAAKLRYKSSNKKIATVDKNGKIKGKKQGTCYIYVYTINGLMKKVKVTVN